MGARGPKGDSPEVKAAKGAVRSKREPKVKTAPTPSAAQPSPAPGVAPPKWLSGKALDIWAQLSPGLLASKLLGAQDVQAFGRYCRDLAAWIALRDGLDTDGFTYDAESYVAGQNGTEGKKTILRRLDPRFLVSDRLARQMLALEDRFGMNPQHRQAIMASRMNTGVPGDLFDQPSARPAAPPQDPAAKPTPPAAPAASPASPVGMLN